MRFHRFFLLAFLCVLAPSAVAQPIEKPKNLTLYFGGEIGVGQLYEDLVLDLRPIFGGEYLLPALFCRGEAEGENADKECLTPLSWELNLPIRLILLDRDPKIANQDLRFADWDTPSDAFRAIRHLSYGRANEPFYASLGAINRLSLGHGTLVSNYSNTVDPNRYKLGFQTQFRSYAGGVSFFVDDLLGADVIGLYANIHPFAFGDFNDFVRRVSIGATFVALPGAPRALLLHGNEFVYDKAEHPIATLRDSAYPGGIDVALTPVKTKAFLLRNYIDVNFVGSSAGAHLGTEFHWKINTEHALNVRLELRGSSKGYIPAYVSPLYDYSQYAYVGWGTDTVAKPLRTVAEEIKGSSMGGFFAAAWNYANYVSLGASYAYNYGRDNDQFTLQFGTHPVDWFSFGLLYYSENTPTAAQNFNPAQAYITSALRMTLWGPVYFFTDYTHRYIYRHNATKKIFNDWELGVGVNYIW